MRLIEGLLLHSKSGSPASRALNAFAIKRMQIRESEMKRASFHGIVVPS